MIKDDVGFWSSHMPLEAGIYSLSLVRQGKTYKGFNQIKL